MTGTSSEPAGFLEDIVIRPDGTGGFEVLLRAERSRRGQGRTYTINATAKDLAGNAAAATATCTVPLTPPTGG